jgi:molybdenum cofactor cytidylyltransferase
LATEGGFSRRLEAVVLAAGAGSRFGGGKLLTPWRGGVLLDGALAAAFAAPVRCVHLVWGADPAVAEAATAFADRAGDAARLRLVHAPRHAEGLSASLAAGVAALPADGEGVFVFLGDMPRLPDGVTLKMAEALPGGAGAVATTFEGRRGHPVLFANPLWPRLLTLSGDRGAGDLLRALGPALALVPAPDDGVLYDVDRPEDLS